jgi:hypothetical protein
LFKFGASRSTTGQQQSHNTSATRELT